MLLVMVGKPWSLIPRHAGVASLDDLRSFVQPGWLNYGMEWILHSVPEDRTWSKHALYARPPTNLRGGCSGPIGRCSGHAVVPFDTT